ncbi:MAG: hypothetical protein ABEL76_17705, partial [Bradymonadaceae bacterium]
MEAEYTEKAANDNVFDGADERYEQLKEKLAGEATGEMTESAIERLVDEDGREIMRQLMQGAVDLRNQGEVEDGEEVVGADGVERTHRIESERTIGSIFGPIFSRRTGYGMRGAETLFLQDAHLNLPADEKYSYEVRRHLVRQAAHTAFEEAMETLKQMKGVEVPKRQAEELTVESMEDFDAFYETRSWPSGARSEGSLQVLS